MPPHVSALLRTWLGLRLRAPFRSLRRGPAPSTCEDVRSSLHELEHLYADRVVKAMEDEGLRPFLVGKGPTNLTFGLQAEGRATAQRAIATLGRDPGWYVDWRRGSRVGTTALDGRPLPRATGRAESWRIYRLYRIGRDVVGGREQGVELTFWAPGADGELERVGVRGHHRIASDAPATTETLDGHRYPGNAALPVERSLTRFAEPVDLVYTWVDGSAEPWRSEFDRWVSIEHPERWDPRATHASRFRAHDDLRYSLRSAWLNAGWIRRIFLVTADQRPPWLVPDDRLRVVAHHEILPADALPTFNSHAIEARLHHIADLSEHFIYMNDDMFIGRALQPEAFYTGNGLSRFFESEARIPAASGRGGELAVNTAARNGQRLIQDAFGRVVTHKLQHAPYALRRSILFEIEDRFRDVISATTRSRFRHPDDLSLPSAFAHHYAFCTARAVPGTIQGEYQNLEGRRLGIFLERLQLGRDVDVFCLNESESTPDADDRIERLVADFLDAYFSVPSPWERRTPADLPC